MTEYTKEELFGKLESIEKRLGSMEEFVTIFKGMMEQEKTPPKEPVTTEPKTPKEPKKDKKELDIFDDLFTVE
jgi:hypothetical protein